MQNDEKMVGGRLPMSEYRRISLMFDGHVELSQSDQDHAEIDSSRELQHLICDDGV